MPIYIYTMPKAGTYFFAAFLQALGFEDTGYHIDRLDYLDTHAHPPEVNVQTPGKAKVKRFFAGVVRDLRANQVAFGHFPLPLHHAILDHKGRYVCAYRDPRRTMVAEFIDFRFRRTGVKWALPAAEPDDRAAFLTYLQRQGVTGHLAIFRDMVLLRSVVLSPLVPPVLAHSTYFVNFDQFRADPGQALPLARFLGSELEAAAVDHCLRTALSAETKTKATDVAVDRDALWSDEAEAIYAASDYPKIQAMAEDLGLVF